MIQINTAYVFKQGVWQAVIFILHREACLKGSEDYLYFKVVSISSTFFILGKKTDAQNTTLTTA